MSRTLSLRFLVGAVSAAFLFGASPAHAQLGNPADNARATANAKVGDADREFFEDIAHANLAEIDTGKMALEKGQSKNVKTFARKMIDDHTKAQSALEALAKRKGITLPTETDVQHKGIATALGALSGNAFDDQYIARVGVGDHERTHELLTRVGKNAKDPDLKAYAAKTVKAVDQHLSMARKMEGKKQ
jgi:putative membrane protein